MKIKKFNEDFEADLDPYGEEDWNDENFYKPDLLQDDDMLVNHLYLPMEKIMEKIDKKEIILSDSIDKISIDVLDMVIYALYGEKGLEFIKKAMGYNG